MTPMPRVVLIHGAASTARVWDRLLPLLDSYDVSALERPRTGDLARELDWVAERAEGAWVVGMSGGATLGLALAAQGVPLAGALLHEPAVGSLAPGLLGPVAAAFADGGTAAFARTLYGAAWSVELCGGPGDWYDDAVTARELAMFRGFEPATPSAAAGRLLVTWGADSPGVRAEAAQALHAAHGYPIAALPGAGHFVAYEQPAVLAEALAGLIAAG